jgi:hypothetical protein
MKRVSQLWRRLVWFSGAQARQKEHVRSLESEISRLRAENRALLNSILGIAGIPPIQPGLSGSPNRGPGSFDAPFTALSPADGHSESPTHSRGGDESPVRPTSSSLPPEAVQSDSSSRKSETRNDSPSRAPSTIHAAAPSGMSPIRRRRSWHQINRILELESARKPVIGDQ